MKKNSFETMLYSVVGVVVMVFILMAVNVVAGFFKQRVDLTKERAYTLSPGTREILQKLDTPVKIRFYYSSSAELPSDLLFLRTYAQQVRDLLSEYRQAAKGKLVIEQYDPKPDSDAEDSARLNGVEGQPLPTGERFYLGVSVSLLDNTVSIPYLDPQRERLLEYDLSRSISRVAKPDKPVVGVMSALPVMGMANNPMLAQLGQRGQDPWILINELKNDFTVKSVDMAVDKIDDDIKVLLVIHPRDISDKTQYAIDQFLLGGGKVIAFLDAVSLTDKSGQQNPMMGQLPGGGTTMDKLVKAWGVQFDTSKVLADMGYMNRRVRLVSGDNPCWLSLSGTGINKDDVVTSEIDDLWIPFCGVFTGTPAEGLTETVLLKSSKNSQLVEGMMATLSGESAMRDFKPSGTEYAVGIRLAGKFKTAFPNGKPEEKPAEGETNKPPTDATPSLKVSKVDSAVVLIGNSDMFADQFCVQQMRTPFGNIPQAINGNLNLAQNLVENMAGDSSLINVRSRATQNHPFTRIKDMEAKADEVFQAKQKEYEDSKQEAQQKISELERNKQPGQRFILSPEQQAERDKYLKKVAELDSQWRQEKKRLAHDKEALQNGLKWTNILTMPIVVALSGLGLAALKKKRTSAK